VVKNHPAPPGSQKNIRERNFPGGRVKESTFKEEWARTNPLAREKKENFLVGRGRSPCVRRNRERTTGGGGKRL